MSKLEHPVPDAAQSVPDPPVRPAAPVPAALAVAAGRDGDVSDAARRDLLRRVSEGHGNRAAARLARRTLARRGSGNAKGLAQQALGAEATARWLRAQRLLWDLVATYCPEKGFALSGSSYSSTQKGFALDGRGILTIGDDVVQRVAGGAADAVGAELAALLKSLPDPFQALIGGTTLAAAPTHVSIPRAMDEGMEAAWKASFPGAKSQEQGGILVTTADGGYKWKAGAAGTSGTFQPNRGDVATGEKLAATAHTHPYDEHEGGHTDVGFSAGDIANLVYYHDKEKVKMVRSGEGDFLVATTKEFDDMVKAAADKNKLYEEVKKTWNDAYAAATGSIQEKVVTAIKKTCLKYHLLIYRGTKGQLAQPRDMVEARRRP